MYAHTAQIDAHLPLKERTLRAGQGMPAAPQAVDALLKAGCDLGRCRAAGLERRDRRGLLPAAISFLFLGRRRRSAGRSHDLVGHAIGFFFIGVIRAADLELGLNGRGLYR